jgi:hypothetical protein
MILSTHLVMGAETIVRTGECGREILENLYEVQCFIPLTQTLYRQTDVVIDI